MAVQTYDKGKIISVSNPIDFIYVHYIPEELTEAVEAEYDEQGDIIGRSSPYVYYKSTQARTFEFPLHLYADSDAEEEVLKRVRWLQSFQYPDYSGQLMRPPGMLRILLGRNFVNLKGVMKGCSVAWKAPYDLLSGIPMQAEISVTLQEVVDVPYDYTHFKPSALKREH